MIINQKKTQENATKIEQDLNSQADKDNSKCVRTKRRPAEILNDQVALSVELKYLDMKTHCCQVLHKTVKPLLKYRMRIFSITKVFRHNRAYT